MPTWMGGRGVLDAGAQMRWAFFPISFHVSSTNVELTPNFQNPFWQFYSLLLFALPPRMARNGIRVILKDYVRHPLLLAWLNAVLVVTVAGDYGSGHVSDLRWPQGRVASKERVLACCIVTMSSSSARAAPG